MTSTTKAQTRRLLFGNWRNGELLSVNQGLPADDALNFAADLAEGVRCLSLQLGELCDQGEPLIYTASMDALAFLGETIAVLIRSTKRGEGEA